MAVIVSDTSPVRALEFLNHLNLLTALFDQVFIPPAVQNELLLPRARFRSIDIQQIPGAILRSPLNGTRVQQLLRELQPGEAEAIALAEELGADLLIDEMAGRIVAARLGLHITGVVGLLVEARKRELIPTVLPLLERLRNELGFFLSSKLIDDVRRDTGE
jgi:predicted nucleic acid-binding protein